jgi:hypothetical protein
VGSPRRAIYTALIGGYERPVLQPLGNRTPGIDWICFTDDSSLTSDCWRVVQVRTQYKSDPIRSARYLKVIGSELIAQYDETIWIDNRVVLRDDPLTLFGCLLGESQIGFPLHSFHNTLEDEFQAVLVYGLDDPRRVREQLAAYRGEAPGLLTNEALWTGMVARRQTSGVAAFNRTWMDQILRYSRRDQLSINFCLQREALPYGRLPINNIQSRWHSWIPERELDRTYRGRGITGGTFRYSIRMAAQDQRRMAIRRARRIVRRYKPPKCTEKP